jgi:hypothetical protein
MPIAPIAASAAGDTPVVAAVTSPGNKKIRVHAMQLWNGVATANSVKLRSGTTDLFAAVPLPLVVGIPVTVSERSATGDYVAETQPGQALNINLSAATAVAGWLSYSLE